MALFNMDTMHRELPYLNQKYPSDIEPGANHHQFLHRIDVNFVIKVADFGLAESIDPTKEYFRQDQNVIIKLPVKWLALESINDGVFSEKSDVVSM